MSRKITLNNDKFLLKFGNNVKNKRLEKSLTQINAAFKAGIDDKYWQKIESKTKPPAISILILKKISIALDCPMADLLEGL